jgi:hypothetical protein
MASFRRTGVIVAGRSFLGDIGSSPVVFGAFGGSDDSSGLRRRLRVPTMTGTRDDKPTWLGHPSPFRSSSPLGHPKFPQAEETLRRCGYLALSHHLARLILYHPAVGGISLP